MDKPNKNAENFKKYFTKKLSEEEIFNKNKVNKINSNRGFFFKHFIFHLLRLIEDTYLNTEQMKRYHFQKEHFDFCWNKTIDYFAELGLSFNYDGEHYNYMLDYLIDCFYNRSSPQDEIIDLKKFWQDIMTMDAKKTQSEYEIFLDCYLIFSQHLKLDGKS